MFEFDLCWWWSQWRDSWCRVWWWWRTGPAGLEAAHPASVQSPASAQHQSATATLSGTSTSPLSLSVSWTSWPRSWWGWGAARWGNAERGLVDSREVRIEINIIMSESVVTIITTAVVMVQPVIDCNQLNSCKLLNLPPGPGPHFLIIFQYLLELNRNFYTETFQ